MEIKRINETIKNKSDKSSDRFSWITSDKEVNDLWSQNATTNISSKSRTNPRVFTDQGIYMLATILKSKVAAEFSLALMDTFVKNASLHKL